VGGVFAGCEDGFFEGGDEPRLVEWAGKMGEEGVIRGGWDNT
jgi:hypothetical protein